MLGFHRSGHIFNKQEFKKCTIVSDFRRSGHIYVHIYVSLLHFPFEIIGYLTTLTHACSHGTYCNSLMYTLYTYIYTFNCFQAPESLSPVDLSFML